MTDGVVLMVVVWLTEYRLYSTENKCRCNYLQFYLKLWQY
jgi:hypothetical protein